MIAGALRATLSDMPKQYASRTGGRAVHYAFVIRGANQQPLLGPLDGMTIEAAVSAAIAHEQAQGPLEVRSSTA
jgi:hypothetical protein